MTDFLITPEGDLVFSESNNDSKRLVINFYKSKVKALKISFDMEGYGKLKPNKNSLTIDFDILEIKNNKRVELIQDDAYLMQQILMRLKTSLGELPLRQEIGSMIETVMHKEITDKALHKKIEKIVSNTIKDLISDCAVKVIPKIEKSDRYNQCIEIYIYKDNSLLLNYGLEW